MANSRCSVEEQKRKGCGLLGIKKGPGYLTVSQQNSQDGMTNPTRSVKMLNTQTNLTFASK